MLLLLQLELAGFPSEAGKINYFHTCLHEVPWGIVSTSIRFSEGPPGTISPRIPQWVFWNMGQASISTLDLAFQILFFYYLVFVFFFRFAHVGNFTVLQFR